MKKTNLSGTWKYRWLALVRKVLPMELKVRLRYLDNLVTDLYVAMPQPTKMAFISHAQSVLGYPTFIETGTLVGQMSEHASRLFERVHTIELDPELTRRAKMALADTPTVTVHHGNSAEVLPVLLQSIDTPCVFWLDAHYSGSRTARGDTDTPILAELESIASHTTRPHAILIDDARVFGTDEAYPSLEEVFCRLRRIDSSFKIGISSDIIWAAKSKLLDFRWRVSALGLTVPPTTAPLNS